MKFLLLNISKSFDSYVHSSRKTQSNPVLAPPLGLLYLGRSLEDEGHTVKLIDQPLERYPIEKIKKTISSIDAVGITVYTYAFHEAHNIIHSIREIDSDIPIIVGGPHPTFHPNTVLNEMPEVNVSLEGDGDEAIKEITKALQGTKKLSDVPGVHYRVKNTIKKGKPLEIIEDLDSIPFPSRHLADKYDYGKVNNAYFFNPPVTALISSRGCPFSCRFCSRHVSSKHYRQRSAENVVKEICEISDKYGSVFIGDDNFLVDKKRVHKIMDSLIKEGTEIELLIEGARVDSAEKELYKKMKKANVKYIGYGIESGNQDVLDFYKKGITLEQIKKAINLCNEMGFISRGCFIFGAPFETEKHFEKTIKFACSLPLDLAIFSPLHYCFGSDLWYEAVKSGKINENEYVVTADLERGLGNFKEEYLTKLSVSAFRRFYLRPQYIIKEITRMMRRNDFRLFQIGINYI